MLMGYRDYKDVIFFDGIQQGVRKPVQETFSYIAPID